MRRLILGLVVLLAAGPVGAVELQEGDVIFSGRLEGEATTLDAPRVIMRISAETGEREILSGCLDADCVEVLGNGPLISGWVVGLTVRSAEAILVNVNGQTFPGVAPEDPLAVCVKTGHVPDGPYSSGCLVLFSINPLTGNRTVVDATQETLEYDPDLNGTRATWTPLLSQGPGVVYDSPLAIASASVLTYFPDPISAGIPLPEWFGLLVVGFLFGVFYMKGKYDGRVVQAG